MLIQLSEMHRTGMVDEENNSWKEFEKEVVFLISVSGMRLSLNISGESGKVSVSGVLVRFVICSGSGKVWSGDVCDVWSTFFNIFKKSRPEGVFYLSICSIQYISCFFCIFHDVIMYCINIGTFFLFYLQLFQWHLISSV